MDLLEEAFHLLRHAPAAVWVCYLAGAVPFAIGLLFFWAEMSHGGEAWRHARVRSLGMALLFVWLKVWQTFFCRALLSRLTGEPSGPWPAGRVARLAAIQAAWQPTSLFLLPIAALIMIPFGWVFAFYQNLTVMGDGAADGKEATRQAQHCARLWPMQNHKLLAILSLAGLFLLLNWQSAFLLVPQLLQSFLGLETIFSRGAAAYLNTTFWAVLAVLVWLSLDPLVKAVYVLRCFHGAARTSGDDLRADLRRLRAARAANSLALAVLLVLPPAANLTASVIQTPSPEAPRLAVKPAELDQTINQVLAEREYAWRIPKEEFPSPKLETEVGFLRGFAEEIVEGLATTLRAMGRGVQSFFNWVDRILGRKLPKPGSDPRLLESDWFSPLRIILYLLLLAFAAVMGWFLYKVWKKRRRRPPLASAAEIPAVRPDLNNESVLANELPGEEWLQMAREMMARGDLRLALRALYLASLAILAERQLILIARHKSNLDYLRELGRRAHALPGLPDAFQANLVVFERVWYGRHETSEPMLAQFQENLERLRGP